MPVVWGDAVNPTDQQVEALGLFLSGCNLSVEAGAGTGKTTTLKLLATSTPAPGAYVAFNRAIVNEASEKMPMTVVSSTAHSLAMRAIGHRYRHRLDTGRMRSWELARLLGLDSLVVTYGGKRKVLQGSYLASLVMRTIRNFAMSADPAPTIQHVPYIDGIDVHQADGVRGVANNRKVREFIEPAIAKAWADLQDPLGALPFSHDHYLKLWQLGDPIIPGEFVLFDEAQDASPVMLAAVEAQLQRGSQLVFVGDSQQQIYEWRGAVNALAQVPHDATVFLTRSWRFGPAIANVANLVLGRLPTSMRLEGNPAIESQVAPAWALPGAILCRTNATAVEMVLRLQRDGHKPHLVGGGDEVLRFARAAADLEAGRQTSHPDLACFDTWKEVQAYVEQDPQGDDLKLLVKLIDEYGIDVIVQALDGMIAERAADVVVSTAHKAKGREWDVVRLAPDFQEPGDGDGVDGEWRLLYVAATRARRVLDVRSCEPIAALLAEDAQRSAALQLNIADEMTTHSENPNRRTTP